MKAQRNKFKITIYALAIGFIFINYACGNKTAKTQKQDAKQTIIQAPKVSIHEDAFMGNVKAIEQHIAAKSDLNIKDQFGSSPLAIAATFNKVDVARALINGGADLSIKGADGSTALHTAAFFCRKEIVSALLDGGADKDATNNYGSTPLQSVSGSFDEVKAIYKQINKDLGPLGLRLDYEELKTIRPEIAELLK